MAKETLSGVPGQNIKYRGDCPFCGGKNTYTASKSQGVLKWNCYSLSCTIRGEVGEQRSIADLLALEPEKREAPFIQPDYWTDWRSNAACVAYLKNNNCMAAIGGRAVQVVYDPKQHRAVFLIKEQEDVVDAVGRRLSGAIGPKWFRYGTSDAGLYVTLGHLPGPGRPVVLVEDAASACSAGRVVDSVALLGTSVSCAHVDFLQRLDYDDIVISLDPDAVTKAIALQRRLTFYFSSVTIQTIPDDLKYLNKEQLEALFTMCLQERAKHGKTATKAAAK